MSQILMAVCLMDDKLINWHHGLTKLTGQCHKLSTSLGRDS
jgi:hypothetical protein